MTDTPNLEWDDWQVAWRGGSPATAATPTPQAANLERRLMRERRAARVYTALDVFVAIVFCSVGVYALTQRRSLPVVVWTISLFVFTASALAWAIWNRRDALVASAGSTSDFLAALRVRLERRERVPRFILRFAAVEMAFGLAFYAIWSPDWLGRAAKIYGVVALCLAAWWRWYLRRLGRERAQLDALGPEPDGPASAGP